MKRTRRKRRDERKGWKEAGGEKVLVAWLQGKDEGKERYQKHRTREGVQTDMSVIKTMELHRRGLLF